MVERQESPEDTKLRHEACDAMNRPRNTRFVTCAAHGQKAPIEDVYAMNNWELRDGHELFCDPSHPFCFAWCASAVQADLREQTSPRRR